jgi:diaminopimelate epimerase
VAKGHGTENDFVLVPDPDGRLVLDPDLVSALCDRRAGLGGDGVLRVVRAAADPEAAAQADQAEWFMDYRNADGSAAQICGNGLRVFVAYLERRGWADLSDGVGVRIATRAGVKTVRRDGTLLAADLGPWFVPGGRDAVVEGRDALVEVDGEPVSLPGLSIDVGNPHVVVALPDVERLMAADLSRAPAVDPAPEHGTNVELVVPGPVGPDGAHLAMRVHERGVGETRSCGTGAVAAALAARVWAGQAAPSTWWVAVPGGRLRVTVPDDAGLIEGVSAELAGTAVIVAEAVLEAEWLREHTPGLPKYS